MDVKRVFIVEDHQMFRIGLKQIIRDSVGFELAGESEYVLDAVGQINNEKVDIVLLDLNLHGESGLKLIHTLRFRGEEPLVCVLSNHLDQWLLEACEKAGANAYVLKDASKDELLGALERLQPGVFIDGMNRLARAKPILEVPEAFIGKAKLSPRELDCLPLLASESREEEVAELLQISVHTLRNHRKSIYRKLGVSSKAELLLFVREHLNQQ